MKILLKSATIIDIHSTLHNKKRDILIDKGEIIKIGTNLIDAKAKEVKANSLCISPGWVDMKAKIPDPGFEYKDTVQSSLDAALKGGFKYVVAMPDTDPVIDNKSQVEYLLSRSKSHAVRILPSGALSQGMQGKLLAEMYDMHQHGAILFSDNKKSVGTEMMTRALEYAQNFNGLIGSFPFDTGVNPGGMVNESNISVQMGLKGLSSSSEEIRLQRDIELLKYTKGRMHVMLISTEGSVELIRKAKKAGLRITCGIAAHQLAFMDKDVADFDSNLKVLPPFRQSQDIKALIKGLKDGTIDVICSDHEPEDHEHKALEFEYANYGISSIQTAAHVAFSVLYKEMSVDQIVEKISTNPAKILGIEYPVVREGQKGPWTIFSLGTEQSFGISGWKSLSRNSPFIEKSFPIEVIS